MNRFIKKTKWGPMVAILLLVCLVGLVAGAIDLTIAGAVDTVPSSTVFAKEPNAITITNVKNQGTDAASNIVVKLYASDVDSGTTSVAETTITSLTGGAQTTLNLVDPTIRNSEGSTVTYTAKVDPDNLIAETDETNNDKSSTAKPLKFNGYKGNRYWEGKSDIITKRTFDLKGDLVYYTQPDTAYRGVGWGSRTETWTAANLPVPTGATIEKVFLFISYNWDNTPGGVPTVSATFNSVPITIGTPYTDQANFGYYGSYKYGLYPAVDVTNLFDSNLDNILHMNSGTGNSNALYPSTLVVIFSDNSKTRKQIFINEGCDLLAYSESGYGTTMIEATAYSLFSGMTVTPGNVQSASLHSFVAGAGPNEGNLLFNGVTVATNIWQGTSNTASSCVFDVTSHIAATENEAGIQGTQSGGMVAIQQILVIEYKEISAPVADFSADDTTPDVGQTVTFTDQSTNTPTSWSWAIEGTEGTDFQYVESTSSTSQNPNVQFLVAGTYDVSLTATNGCGSDTETKTDYITVTAAPVPTIDVTLGSSSVILGNMIAEEDAAGSTTVNVEASGGSSWTVTASDGKSGNTGYMVSGITHLANPIQLGKDGSGYQSLNSGPVTFWSDTSMGSSSATADLKQLIAAGDAPGDYEITITFTGSIT